MKVAMVTPYWFPIRGGVTTYVSELSESLRGTYGVDVRVITREGAEADSVVGGAPREFVARAAEELERIAPDAVHAHGHWYALQAAVRYRNRHPATRVIFTLHTEFQIRSRVRRFFLGRLLSQADFLTAVSADLLERTLRGFRPRTRTRVTRPGVALHRASVAQIDDFLQRTGLAGRRPFIAFVGPLAYERKARGVGRVIRAMRAVRAHHPAATFVVAGDGPFRAHLEAMAAREAPGAVTFLGDIDDPATFLSAADVYAHISFQEGLPLAVLEAMACGTPVVATPAGGTPEVIRNGENGLLVSGDPDELADALGSLLESPGLRDRLAARASQDTATWAWTKTAAKFHELYGRRTPQRVVVSVDLERDYHVPRASFRGIEEALPKLLALFEKHGVRANFFATADLCAAHAPALREILRRGHSLGCHGESHDVPYLSSKPYRWQVESIRRATEAIASATGVRPEGFRAPNFSANGATIRALERLGYRYDSSVLPGRIVRWKRLVKRLDFLAAPGDPYRPARGDPAFPGSARLTEFPVTENPSARGGPIGLGFLNANGVERTLEALATTAASPTVFLIHPWELLEPPPAPAPAWTRTACSPDPAKLDAFLAAVRKDHRFTRFEDEIAEAVRPEDWRQGDAMSDEDPPTTLFLVTNVYRPIVGGISSYVGQLEKVMTTRASPRVYAYPGLLVGFEARTRPRVRLPRPFHVAFGVYVILAVAAERLRGRRVIVHSHSATFCLLVGSIARLFGARAVHTLHSPLSYRSLTLEWLASRLDAVVFVSPATRENYEDMSGTWNDRERLLPGAVEAPPPVDAAERRQLRGRFQRTFGVPLDATLVLLAGRVVEDKGAHVLAEAARIAGGSVFVVVAGPPGRTGDDRRYFARLESAAAPGPDRLRILGEVPNELLEDLYRACDIVAIPSLWAEPAPMVAVEAMAHGKPVVASRVGGLPFLVPDGTAGLLVPPGDAAALADAIRRIAGDDELRKRLSAGARATARERHSLARFAIEHARLYSSL